MQPGKHSAGAYSLIEGTYRDIDADTDLTVALWTGAQN